MADQIFCCHEVWGPEKRGRRSCSSMARTDTEEPARGRCWNGGPPAGGWRLGLGRLQDQSHLWDWPVVNSLTDRRLVSPYASIKVDWRPLPLRQLRRSLPRRVLWKWLIRRRRTGVCQRLTQAGLTCRITCMRREKVQVSHHVAMHAGLAGLVAPVQGGTVARPAGSCGSSASAPSQQSLGTAASAGPQISIAPHCNGPWSLLFGADGRVVHKEGRNRGGRNEEQDSSTNLCGAARVVETTLPS